MGMKIIMDEIKYPFYNESLNETIYLVRKNFIYFFTTVSNFKFWKKISRKLFTFYLICHFYFNDSQLFYLFYIYIITSSKSNPSINHLLTYFKTC